MNQTTQITLPNGKLDGALRIVSSKSYSQRALLAAFLSGLYSGEKSEILALDNSRDTTGVERVVELLSSTAGDITINIGESGLATRLFAPVAVALGRKVTIEGEGSILSRPMDFITTSLREAGVSVSDNSGFLPMTIDGGALSEGEFLHVNIDGSQGSQYLSGVLFAMAALSATRTQEAVVEVVGLKSRPYIDMTVSVLETFGVSIDNYDYKRFTIKPRQNFKATTYTVEGDWSGASVLLAAAAICSPNGVCFEGLNLASQQADRVMMDALVASGANVALEGEKEGFVVNSSGTLRAFEFDATHAPDLFPALAVLAAGCEGVSHIKGVSRLKHKESDRATALRTEFAKAGVRINILGDVMEIHGGGAVSVAHYDSWGDHRIAMAVAALSLRCPERGSTLTGADSVGKSYPEFWDALRSLLTDSELEQQ